jgi:hypothetical protein
MNKRSGKISFFSGILITIGIIVSACTITINTGSTPVSMPTAIDVTNGNQAPAAPAVPAASPTLNPNMPGEPMTVEGQMPDTDSSKYASEKRVVSGDSYKANFFERPFTATSMVYLPDVDIINGYISSDENFIYFTIELTGTNKDNGGMNASYGVELDTDKDGRGDYSIWALNPAGTTWTTNNVTIRKDNNHSIGGKDPYIADESLFLGDGYETLTPNDGADAAWVRINSNVANIVQIAVHRNIIGNPAEFLWGVWADNGPKNPNLFDYNDHFTYQDAGSPISGNQYYPLKKVAAIDNTCRRTYGFTVTYRIPNMCWSGGPVITTPAKEFKFLCLTCLLKKIP